MVTLTRVGDIRTRNMEVSRPFKYKLCLKEELNGDANVAKK